MNLRFNCKHEDCGDGTFIRLPVVPVIIKGKEGYEPINFTAILDTGSPFVLIPKEMADLLGLEYSEENTREASGYGGERFTTTYSEVILTIQKGHENLQVKCRCAIQLDGEKEHEHLIIGSSFFEHVKVEFDYSKNKFYIKEAKGIGKSNLVN